MNRLALVLAPFRLHFFRSSVMRRSATLVFPRLPGDQVPRPAPLT
jgi:hypothetical protein